MRQRRQSGGIEDKSVGAQAPESGEIDVARANSDNPKTSRFQKSEATASVKRPKAPAKAETQFEACFLGPKADNLAFFRSLLDEALEHHAEWRRSFHLDDPAPFVSQSDRKSEAFRHTQERIRETLHSLQELLKRSQPFFSPRYIGHMNWEAMMASIVAYFSASLYNPNNVAWAGSTGTSDLELEVGRDLLRLFGMSESAGWGHICAGGTIANMEALWIARNLKAMPLALKRACLRLENSGPEVRLGDGTVAPLAEASDEQLLRAFSSRQAVDLREAVIERLKTSTEGRLKDSELDDLLEAETLQEKGLHWEGSGIDLGVVFLPQSKHYSFKKAMDLLGLGRSNIHYVPLDQHFRMDISVLEAAILETAATRPILAVVGVMGTTEESAVDRIDAIIDLRRRLAEERGIHFHVHVDAAYGGYARSLFVDDGGGHFMAPNEMGERLKELRIIGDKPDSPRAGWPSAEVYQAFESTGEADTLTVDPHKLGYVPYSAGAIIMRDRRFRDAIRTFAPYVFPKPKPGEPDILIGSYILEGSKPGAAAAAVWAAHRILPLNIGGYGKLIGETIDGAQALCAALDGARFDVDSAVQVRAFVLTPPDLNIVDYVFNIEGNTDLDRMNALTALIAESAFGYRQREGESMLQKSFIVSSTDLTKEEYGDTPLVALARIGIAKSEWDRVGAMKVARSVVMSPYLTTDYVDEDYVARFLERLQQVMTVRAAEIIKLAGSLRRVVRK